MNTAPFIPEGLALDETTNSFLKTLIWISDEHQRSRRRSPNLFPLVRLHGVSGVVQSVNAMLKPLAVAHGTSDITRLTKIAGLGLLLSPKRAQVTVASNGELVVNVDQEGSALTCSLPFGGKHDRTIWLGEHVDAAEDHVTVHLAPHRLVQLTIDDAHVPVLERLVDGVPFVFPQEHAASRVPGLENTAALKKHVLTILARG